MRGYSHRSETLSIEKLSLFSTGRHHRYIKITLDRILDFGHTPCMFRIYTEDKNRPMVEKILSERLPSFTIIPAIGFWQGAKESSLCIEVLESDRETIASIASVIKAVNKQDAVLITEVHEDHKFI